MTARRTAALVGCLLLATSMAPAAAVQRATGTTASTSTPAAERTAPARTRLSFTVADCEGCEVSLANGRRTLDADAVHVWQSRTRTVEGGEVTFRIATRRTWGMSVAVRAPWEGHTGYVTTVAWRYNGRHVGDTVTLEDAVTRRRAAACWEGTRARRLTVPLAVEEVEVDGVRERVPGSIAFVPVTQSWLDPMRVAPEGVLGSQDVNICR